jgi:hypothetical protein
MSVSLKNIGGLQSIVSYSAAAGAPPPFNTKSLELDGTGDAFKGQLTEAQIEQVITNSHTYSIWVKADWDASFTMIGYTDTGSFVAGSFKLNYTYFNAFVDALSITGKFSNSNWTTTTLINHASTDDASAWVHFCVTQTRGAGTGDAGSYVLYINGVAQAPLATPSGGYQAATEVSTGCGIAFGANNSAGTIGENMTGKIDEIGIWVVALDADAVTAIYNAGVPTDLTVNSGNYDNAARLKYYWRLEDDAVDTKGNSDGATVGDPSFSTDLPE